MLLIFEDMREYVSTPNEALLCSSLTVVALQVPITRILRGWSDES